MLLAKKDERRFDTFILGRSRSFGCHCDALSKMRPGCRPLYYPAASENLYGVYKKILFSTGSG
jgi:hypothetical protein